MLGVSAYDLYKPAAVDADADADVFPAELNIFAGRVYVFIASVTQYNLDNNYHVYIVSKFSNEEALIGNFQQPIESSEETVDSVPDSPGVVVCVPSPSTKTVSPCGKHRTSEESVMADVDTLNFKKKLVIPKKEVE